MKEKSLGFLSSYSFKGRLVIAIEEKWKNFFQDTPIFEAVIDKDKRYTLRGPIVSYSPHNADPTAVQEDTADE
jgi:hypothetical protein